MSTKFVFFLSAVTLLAQPPGSGGFRRSPDGPPPGGPGGFMRESRLVKGQPYSADVVTESVQVLADGNRIVRKSTGAVYRDSEGRTRREHAGSGMGPVSAQHKSVTIFDPVAGVELQLQPDSKTASKMAVHGGGPNASGAGHPVPAGARERPSRAQRQRPNVTTEDLGTQVIEGIAAQGRRTTRTTPAGEVGNEKELKTVDEVWFSAELQVTVQSRHSDPLGGDVTYKLANVRRAEPASTLFQAPSDYQLQERGHRAATPRPAAPAQQ